MIEIYGNLWEYEDLDNHRICITTNGSIKNNGEAVMGRGCAFQAKSRWPILPKLLGESIRRNGNVVQLINLLQGTKLVSFPVKHEWNEKADLKLIEKSAIKLNEISEFFNRLFFILPRPGCGNRELNYIDVKKVIEPILNDRIMVIDFKQ